MARKRHAPAPAWPEAVDQFGAHLANQERSDLTVAAYVDDLARFGAWYQSANQDPPILGTISSEDLRDWKRHQLELSHAPRTINRRLAAVRTFLRWTEGNGWTIELQTPQSVRQVKPGPKWLTPAEERALLRAVRAAGEKRDVALVVVLLRSGLRVAELVALEWRDVSISPRKGELVVRKGKGAKQRTVPLHAAARDALKALDRRRPGDKVFTGQRGDLTKSGAQKIIARYGRAIGVDLSAHILRHTCAKRLIDAGTPLHVVARILGHESTKTTEGYVTPSEEDLQGFIDRLPGGEE
jgi:site-specific recombinase XerD